MVCIVGMAFTDILVVIGLIVMSYLFGRFSHLIPLSFFQRSLPNTAKASGNSVGLYSSKFYKNNQLEHTKLVLCARSDLKMKTGKIAAQCSHATLGVVKKVETEGDDLLLQIWRNYGQPKIVTKIKSPGELKELKQKAIDAGVPYYVVCDAGRTQVPSGSYTVLAVGPAPDSILQPITGSLKLL